MTRPIRVLVVDDSAFNRRFISDMLSSAEGIEVVGTAYDGQIAIKRIETLKPDVITLDLEMPVLDGFAALRWIMANRPLPVIVVSSHATDVNVFKALDMGAVDFIAKPTPKASLELKEIANDLIAKIRAAVVAHLKPLRRPLTLTPSPKPEKPFVPRKDSAEIVLIGSSTGGPTNLQRILSAMPEHLTASFLIAQHMPPVFTGLFAERMNRTCALKVQEVVHKTEIKPGNVYIAPGGMQMFVSEEKKHYILNVVKKSDNDRFAPSINILFKSAAETISENANILAVILTGMGGDGREGVEALKKIGAATIVESPETAIIRTMPEEMIKNKLADIVCDAEEIPAEILRRCLGGQNEKTH